MVQGRAQAEVGPEEVLEPEPTGQAAVARSSSAIAALPWRDLKRMAAAAVHVEALAAAHFHLVAGPVHVRARREQQLRGLHLRRRRQRLGMEVLRVAERPAGRDGRVRPLAGRAPRTHRAARPPSGQRGRAPRARQSRRACSTAPTTEWPMLPHCPPMAPRRELWRGARVGIGATGAGGVGAGGVGGGGVIGGGVVVAVVIHGRQRNGDLRRGPAPPRRAPRAALRARRSCREGGDARGRPGPFVPPWPLSRPWRPS